MATLVMPEHLLARAAFELLSSSTVNRYANVAISLAQDDAVRSQLSMQEISTSDLLTQARDLVGIVAASTLREPEEFTLAIIMALLADAASPDAEELLTRVALRIEPPFRWLAGAARLYLTQRRSNDALQVDGGIAAGIQPATSAHFVVPIRMLRYVGLTADRSANTSFKAA